MLNLNQNSNEHSSWLKKSSVQDAGVMFSCVTPYSDIFTFYEGKSISWLTCIRVMFKAHVKSPHFKILKNVTSAKRIDRVCGTL